MKEWLSREKQEWKRLIDEMLDAPIATFVAVGATMLIATILAWRG